MRVKRHLDAIDIAGLLEALIHGERGYLLASRLCLGRVEGHVVVGYAWNSLELVGGLEIKELDACVHVHEPESVDVVDDEVVSDLGVGGRLDNAADVSDDVREKIHGVKC